MTFEYWALFQSDNRPERIVVTNMQEFLQRLERLMLERGPLVWIIR